MGWRHHEYLAEVAAGMVPNRSIMVGLGERETMATTAAGEDLWRGNELSPAPTSHTTIPTPDSAGEAMSVVSESADDAAGGTGARSVMIHYLDPLGDDQAEVVEMNGTTPVPIPATIRFVNDVHVMTAGAGLVTAGHIKVHQTADAGLVYQMIAAGGNKSLVPHRMVPRGHYLTVHAWHAEEAQARRCAIRIRSTSIHGTLLPGVFLFLDTAYLKQTATGHLELAAMIPELAILKVSGWADANGAEASCGWFGVLVKT